MLVSEKEGPHRADNTIIRMTSSISLTRASAFSLPVYVMDSGGILGHRVNGLYSMQILFLRIMKYGPGDRKISVLFWLRIPVHSPPGSSCLLLASRYSFQGTHLPGQIHWGLAWMSCRLPSVYEFI